MSLTSEVAVYTVARHSGTFHVQTLCIWLLMPVCMQDVHAEHLLYLLYFDAHDIGCSAAVVTYTDPI